MTGMITAGLVMSGFGTWIIWRSAPKEVMNVAAAEGSQEQRLTLRLMRTTLPVGMMACSLLYLVGLPTGWILVVLALFLVPLGVVSLKSDRKVTKKDEEFSTFLRSTGGMATSSGTTLKEALTKIDLTSFPTLQPDIARLSTRLQALVDPEICWHKFGLESGSKLISEVIDIFYSGIKIGGDPERVGYLCSLFTAKTSQLRAKRRLTAGTFSGLTTVMQAVVAGLMVFVLSIVQNFAALVKDLMPSGEGAEQGKAAMNMTMAQFTPAELQFLSLVTVSMILALAAVSAGAVIATDGGYKLKVAFFLALTIFVSGVCFIVVPPMVDSILTM
jgi:flagellar protein FlaJ